MGGKKLVPFPVCAQLENTGILIAFTITEITFANKSSLKIINLLGIK